MTTSIVSDIKTYLLDFFRDYDEVPLRELLWSIDVKHFTYPTEQELNEAVKDLEGIEIVRNEGFIVLKQSREEKSDLFNDTDVERSLKETWKSEDWRKKQ
ncbi:MAG: hypothetical protein ACPGU4_10090 [Flavobacteriales bacterium]